MLISAEEPMRPRHPTSVPWSLRVAFWLPLLTIGAAVTVAFLAVLERVRLGTEAGDFVVGGVLACALGSYVVMLFAVLRGSSGARLFLTMLALLVVGGLLMLPRSTCGCLLLAGSPALLSVALMWTPRARAFIRSASAAARDTA